MFCVGISTMVTIPTMLTMVTMATMTYLNVDILSLIGKDTRLKRVASTKGGEYAGPCPFCGGKDRFRVWPEHPSGKGRWWCRKCGRSGDAIDYVRQRDGLSFAEALATLGLQGASRGYQQHRHRERKEPPERPVYSISDPPSWDADLVKGIVAECQALLRQDVGKGARDYLHKRGLNDETLKVWGIGYNPKDRWIGGLFTPRGIVIPWMVDGTLWLVKVRRPVPPLSGPKYQQLKGGGKGALYGLDHLAGKRVVLICEGEFDAVLAWQEAGDLVDVVALGSATSKPGRKAVTFLLGAKRWLVATDRDKAGEKGAAWWETYTARARRVRPLQGHDLTEFWESGGDLRAWVRYYLDRHLGTMKGGDN